MPLVDAEGQFIEQEPGPRGSPQWPQPPLIGTSDTDDAPPALRAANTDWRFWSFGLSQDGHMGAWPLRTRASNW